MGNKFTTMAKKVVGGSPVMQGKKKIGVEDLIRQFPNGITITGFDIITTEDAGEVKTYPVIEFAEDNGLYFNGGVMITNIINEWLQNAEGDLVACNQELKSVGGAKFVVSQKKTNKGKTVTVFDPVD